MAHEQHMDNEKPKLVEDSNIANDNDNDNATSTNSTKDIVIEVIVDHEETRPDDTYTGVCINTTQQTIKCLITNFASCCEEFDVQLHNADNLRAHDMIGAEIESVSWGDKIAGQFDFDTGGPRPSSCAYDDTAIVNVVTNKGLFQLIAFNEHNGYYPHDVYVEWRNYSDQQTL